ncbi:type I polyketide synthase [Streptomyces sp. NPDC088147]|uniref:type I polyketide synthase n=1 Tax=Streptomyces sp. NPDC088147 TaxID=3365830 RepID=UPI00381D397E
MTGQNAVAIIGMACRFPGARDVGAYWANLRAAEEGIRRLSPGELRDAGVDAELIRRPDFVPAKGALPGAHRFDWSFFGYSRAEAAVIDPQQRVFLECASQAVDDAGIDPRRFPGWIGVYAGADAVRLSADEDLDPLIRVIGREKDFLATRVAYKLGFRGPAVTVQTACSTSLTAVHTAVQSLLCHESDAALAGGVTVTSPGQLGYVHKEGGILSRDGRCRPFDAAADGTVPSEGVGVVVLKRLEDAVRDHDRISAVILGSAINNDGAEKIGYTAPSVTGQREVIHLAHRLAGIDPADLGYVEAHGTGTRIGDPVEVRALTEAFRSSTDATGYCRLGSVKSNLGHVGAAAGVAGLIKTALMLRDGVFVPTLHYREPNPLLEIEKTPFLICAESAPWRGPGPRLAGVSSFGVGGTNAHVVLQEAPERTRRAARPRPRLLAVSAASPSALDRTRSELAARLESAAHPEPGGDSGTEPGREPGTDLDLADVSWTLAAGRRVYGHRRTVVAESLVEAAERLRGAPTAAAEAEEEATGAATAPTADGASTGSDTPRVAFLFPGQGVLRDGAGASAYRLLTGFREHFDELADEVRRQHGVDLSPAVAEDPDPRWFTDTVHQQLGLLALGHAFGRQLGRWGIEPAAMLGNSIGEYVAAVLADVWPLPDAVRLVHSRAEAMRDTAPGRMVAVNAGADRLASLLARHSGISLAVAGPDSAVLSGTEADVTRLLADAAATEDLMPRTLETERAFHSPLMAPAVDRVRAAVAAAPGRPARYRLVSNLTGTWTDPESAADPEYWAEHLRRTVRLADGMDAVLADGCDVLIELGPGASLLGGVRRSAGWDSARLGVAPLGGAEARGETALLRALGALWERGLPIPLDQLRDTEPPSRCSLPAHPLDSREPVVESGPVDGAGTAGTGTPVPANGAAAQAPYATDRPDAVRRTLEQHWCQVLGVPHADDQDDFFVLGGESLLAVHFMSRLKQRTGLHLPVAEFLERATFGRLVELAGRQAPEPPDHPPDHPAAQAPHRTPGLVVLHAEGAGTPLFLAADALGTTAGYRSLAQRLDDGRPVYGLEPTAPSHDHVRGRGRVSVEDIAARHVETLRRVQPQGPYLLGGWSFGAVVAHEMARRLLASGAEVESLLLLDGHVPDTGGRPLVFDRGYLRSGVRLQLHTALGRGAVGELVRGAPELRRLFNAHIRALWRYRPRAVGCHAVILRTGSGAARLSSARDGLHSVYPGGVRVRPVGGDHWSMLTEPHVGQLAETIRQALAAPKATSRPEDGEPGARDGRTSDDGRTGAVAW